MTAISTAMRLLCCRRGSVAPIFGGVVCSVVAFAGMGYDYGAAMMVRSGYQNALDATVAAAELRPDLLDSDLYDFAWQQFRGIVRSDHLGRLKSFAFHRDADGVRASAEADVPMPFAGLLGLERVEIKARTVVAY